MVTRVTSAIPIISAPAFAPVRCGLRVRVLAREDAGRAREPAPGTPSTSASGRISCAEKSATPTKTSTAPTPMKSRTRWSSAVAPKSPKASSSEAEHRE